MNPFEILVMISNPDNFLNWSDEQKLKRYERVMQWHEYIRGVHKAGKAPQVWGSHQLLSRANFVSSLGLLLAVYRVESWAEFDELLSEDPLRDVSRYVTTPLASLLEDREGDLERYERAKQMLLGGGNSTRQITFNLYSSLFSQQPEFVGTISEYSQPKNSPTDIDATEQPGDPLQIMLMGVNPEEAVTLWDETRMLIHYEKVNWWHDYMSMLVEKGKVSHVWGAHNFFDITGLSGLAKGAGVAIYQVKDFDEFDSLYRDDPIREMTLFWTVLLQPIANQRLMDEKRLTLCRTRM